jgi:hypothetical protein
MLAFAAAAVFAFALLLDWLDESLGDAFTPTTLMFLGLLLIALHLAGVGANAGSRGWTRSRSRR